VSDSSKDPGLEEAVLLLRQGHASQAEGAAHAILSRDPSNLAALSVLGASAHAQGKAALAIDAFTRLASLQPAERLHWTNLGTSLRLERRYDEALNAFQRAAELGEKSANFFYNVGLLHFDRRDFEAARAVLERAVALAPRDAAIRVQYARALQERMRSKEALAALEGWDGLEGLDTEVLAQIANLLINLGAAKESAVALERARLDPAPPPAAAIKIIEILERSNQLAEAREALDRLKRSPAAHTADPDDLDNTEAVLAQREGRHEEARVALERLLANCPAFHLRQYHLFRLAKSLDALGRYEEAFTALAEAHRSQVEHFKMTQPEIALHGPAPLTITERDVDPADVAAWNHEGAPAFGQSPIFIVGFPRSGTTLLELALDAHSALRTMDEQPFIQSALDDLVANGARYPEHLSAIGRDQLDAVRSAYWQRVRGKVELHPGERLIDKNPLNILRLPVIRRLFPASPILLAVRHPCDVILSCYMQHFGDADFALLCRDLPSIASGYRRMFDSWYRQSAKLGVAAHEVQYEKLVADFEPGIRRICEALTLDFEPAMLEPARHASGKAFISTPSYSQVVKPVNTRSVDRWRHYERHFTAALPALAPYLQRWGYAS
jgi:tetratricopeptide (TPR) repeat protein